jgi:hypothetical protein
MATRFQGKMEVSRKSALKKEMEEFEKKRPKGMCFMQIGIGRTGDMRY